jgi:hypothetical protein
MKFTKKRDYDGTIRKVWDNDKTKCYGVVGTVKDLLREQILDYCDAPDGTWCFIPLGTAGRGARFADTRDGTLFGLN